MPEFLFAPEKLNYAPSLSVQFVKIKLYQKHCAEGAESGKPLLEITADKTGRHDTLGGACSSQSNTVRYAREKRYMHNCRDSFMLQLADTTADIKKRDLAPNINFFMNVPITKEGGYKFDDGVSAPGKYVEMKALADVMILISNCPQLNNPCNAYNPTPVRLLIWD